jgi:hypothetical protein
MSDVQYIELKRVVTDKDTKENKSINKETMKISRIEFYRGWHKGLRDKAIKGEMTLLMVKPYSSAEEEVEKEVTDVKSDKLVPVLIEESYESFSSRMSERVVVKRLGE